MFKFPNIKILLVKNNETQNDLAEILSMHPSTLSNKMTGKVDFTYSEMIKLKEHFGEGMDYIFNQ